MTFQIKFLAKLWIMILRELLLMNGNTIVSLENSFVFISPVNPDVFLRVLKISLTAQKGLCWSNFMTKVFEKLVFNLLQIRSQLPQNC
jgi:hypothetical protein